MIGIFLVFGAQSVAKDRVPLYVDCFELQEVRDAAAVIKAAYKSFFVSFFLHGLHFPCSR